MFSFFSTFKTDVKNAFTALQSRLAAIESKLDTLFSAHVDSTTAVTGTPAPDAAPKAAEAPAAPVAAEAPKAE